MSIFQHWLFKKNLCKVIGALHWQIIIAINTKPCDTFETLKLPWLAYTYGVMLVDHWIILAKDTFPFLGNNTGKTA